MQDAIRTQIDYPEISRIMTELLHLEGSPVAIKFITEKEYLPEGVRALEEKATHCQMVNMARKEGKIDH